jgi:hypothetical protein
LFELKSPETIKSIKGSAIIWISSGIQFFGTTKKDINSIGKKSGMRYWVFIKMNGNRRSPGFPAQAAKPGGL